MFRFMLFALLFTVSSVALAGQSRYVDAINYPSDEASWDRFYDLADRLDKSFDFICGDTFCEGDYGNLRSMNFTCSVDRLSGTMGECLWTFAGGYENVDGKSGEVVSYARIFSCRAPLAPHTPVEAFYAALEGRNPIDETLPGTQTTIYEGLTDCL
ncbi:hypothetical protein EC912_10734 [Luteibacter rhizovicinus]|uniref:Secreted protein n=1 Tax=Luteibacter rhizovicinus TaxID=242606 RepID=A0A4R3YLJ5_9GAMM|nr:hypothetical protein [Luteibacter rhizovicinus]TCV92328.1 hypothetical protein EC912_10734 [Luteibacter rhizovicinus]